MVILRMMLLMFFARPAVWSEALIVEAGCSTPKYVLYVKKRKMVKGMTEVLKSGKNDFLYASRMDVLKFDQNLTLVK
jgi:hypothetical protein